MSSSKNCLKLQQLDQEVAHWNRMKQRVLRGVSQSIDTALNMGTCNAADLLWWTHYERITDVLKDITTQHSQLASAMTDEDWDHYDGRR